MNREWGRFDLMRIVALGPHIVRSRVSHWERQLSPQPLRRIDYQLHFTQLRSTCRHFGQWKGLRAHRIWSIVDYVEGQPDPEEQVLG